MADFRKWFLVLAVLAAFVIPANAQVTCFVASSNIPIRAEGLAELVSAIDLNCTGTAPATTTTASFTAFFTTDVTSVRASSTSLNTEAVLTAADGSKIQGVLNGTSSLVFNGVPIPAPPFTLRINNVRVNASKVGSGGSVTVIMSATSQPANSVVFTGTPTAVPAVVQTGLVFTAASAASLQQCAAPSSATVNATFTEGFSSAFKNFNEESGITTGVLPPGSATQGTRLFIRVSNVPGNVSISVPGSIGGTGTETAFLVGFNPATGGTGSGVVAGIGSGLTPITDTTNQFAVPLTSGAGTAVYEITGTGLTLTSVDKIVVPVTITTSTGVQATTSASVPSISGGFAPTSTVAVGAPATGTGSAPVPRFVDVANQNLPLFSVTPCVTTLLFPFVTNVAGFDTGIALVNTSLDNAGSKAPFNTTPQHGACTVFYFNGATTAPAPQTTGDIPAGGMAAFNLQSGGVAGSTSSAAGFQGYIIAQCNFQFAHGFAFISDRNTPSLGSQGYLALVIPDRGKTGRLAANFTAVPADTVATGEQLAQ